MLSFASAPGNFFNRIGKIGLVVSQVRAYQLALQTDLTDTTNGVVAQYNTEADLQALVGSAYLGALSAPEAICTVLSTLAEQTLNRMIFRDNPRLSQTLDQLNTTASIAELIRQMKASGATVQAMTITATPGAFKGLGNGVLNASVIRPLDGLTLENAFAESLLFTVNTDSYSGQAVAGNEQIGYTGTGTQSDYFAFNWPLGSNASANVTAIDGDQSNASNNILTNSGFGTWSGGAPANFLVDNGLAIISQNTGIVYSTGSSLQITGDGATNVQLRQQFGSSNGTLGTLSASSQYSFNLFFRRAGAAISAGTLVVDLVDGGNTTLKDPAGTLASATIDLTQLTTSWSNAVATFRTPAVMPSSYYLRLRTTTPVTGGSIFWDKMSLGSMSQAYTSGPFVAVHAGSVPFEIGDYANLVITNSRGAGGSLNTFQTLLPRLLPVFITQEFLLPSSATPTIPDTLIG